MELLSVLLTTLYFLESNAYQKEFEYDCPLNCICYSDYLHNLESWKWVEPNVHYDKDDPEHESFNPYLEHNEVMENPKLHRKSQRQSMLSTVTCMIRSNGAEGLEKLFNALSSNTQVLSLIQAPGAGAVILKKEYFKKFYSLVGLEINGYSDKNDVMQIAGDSFKDLQSLTYLNLETVTMLHNSVENNIHDISSRYLKINYTFNDIETNELTSQILIISPEDEENREKDVLPYYEYKKTLQTEKTAPLQPTFRVAFTGLPKLQHLKLSGCNLHDISWDMFYKLESLKYLVLDENDLLFLPDFVFYATTNLTALSLSRNRILNLQTVGLAGLLYLQKLDVTYNNITHLSELSLPPFPHLEVADFRHNPITSIFPNTFEIMNSTKTLYLGSSSTALDLSPNSFYGLSSLTKLDITNVKIRLLEKSMLTGMPALKTLSMTGNIPRISYDAFGEVTNLEKLILRNCGLKKISMDAFFGLSSLIELDLSHNSLSFLPPGIFEDQTSLREVFLQYNKLTTLPSTLIDNLPVKMIRLEANPWHCSCDMKTWNPQLTNRVKRYHVPAPNNTLCQKVYDKGSMCFETYEPKFEVTYSYEKRVSPVCETPMKFNHRSVFQVLRRELKYCSSNVPNTENRASEQITRTNSSTRMKPFPENYSFDTLTALEKQLLAKPIKVKKNRTQQTPQNNSVFQQAQTNYGSNDEDNFIISNNVDFTGNISLGQGKKSKVGPDVTETTVILTEEVSPNQKIAPTPTAYVPTEMSTISTNNTNTFVSRETAHVRNKPKGRKKNRNRNSESRNRNSESRNRNSESRNRNNRPSLNLDSDRPRANPSISRKAMKLARMLQRQQQQNVQISSID